MQLVLEYVAAKGIMGGQNLHLASFESLKFEVTFQNVHVR